MSENYIATIDRGRLRIYTESKTFGQRIPRLEIVEAMDIPNFSNSEDAGDDEAAGAVEDFWRPQQAPKAAPDSHCLGGLAVRKLD